MNRFVLVTGVFLYYLAWLLLPIFDIENTLPGFPLPSIYAVICPVVLLLTGLFCVVSFLGILVLYSGSTDKKSRKMKSS
ncbi:LAME_0D07778g1_1 [Lachancea meyersii CBS 8951]|uniref:Dolichol phosphate-mannose biosynthesis regulatory protein n=1 Tax=Lachancea meyersii CBS 8951 TaxID=1266667 RepID=A0A1G4J9Y0_9SACH|nr:LAME_0D07778g1_1 [Lachancea meyersii CBS 8951]